MDRNAVVIAHLVQELIGLGVQAAGVEREHREPPADLRRQIHEHDVLGAAERNRDVRAELGQRELHDLARDGATRNWQRGPNVGQIERH